ncbi:UDP-glucose 6-dehydrogenase [Vallitalea longa]|uniref:UDP-glucose 6-dehydrogenase n=1 Tax=Vallitalea longa TaxID=2936439 RepID=A0A9W5YG18_9FIRM|nr:UDP-glucose/GDP-mannose dehydrogenase family protein [Vallitalea longa]GKX31254.1 UDP-glucose 6-dehydrogenase [Vallitalea longa]
MKICVIGAGYVGLVAALSFAKYKNDVICVDKDVNKVNQLNKGIPTIYEEGLEPLLKKCLEKKYILFTNNIRTAISLSDVIMITVGTPTNPDWSVDISQVIDAANEISISIDKYKVIIIKSTVPVGTHETVKNIFINRGVNENNFDVVSNPEFLREGRALNDFLNGDRMVIGSNSKKAIRIINKIYGPFKTKIIYTNPPTAELIKYASNALLATKISFINEMANLCSKVDANIETLSYGLGLDKRISKEFLNAGIGYGGSCFPKDTKALVNIGEKYGCEFNIVRSTIKVNENQRLKPVEILLDHYNKIEGKTIAILGLTFKPGTDDIRDAPSLYIIDELLSMGAKIKCYDPTVSKEMETLFPNITYCNSIIETVKDSHCAIICTELDEFYKMDLKIIAENMKKPVLIDGRNIIRMKKAKKSGFSHYYSIGNGSFEINDSTIHK